MTTFSIIWYFCLWFNALAIYNSRRLDLISVHQGLVFCISDSSWVGWSKLHLSYYISLLHCSCDSIHWNSFTKFMRIALNSLFGKRPRSHEFFLTCSCWFWSPAVISVAAFLSGWMLWKFVFVFVFAIVYDYEFVFVFLAHHLLQSLMGASGSLSWIRSSDTGEDDRDRHAPVSYSMHQNRSWIISSHQIMYNVCKFIEKPRSLKNFMFLLLHCIPMHCHSL